MSYSAQAAKSSCAAAACTASSRDHPPKCPYFQWPLLCATKEQQASNSQPLAGCSHLGRHASLAGQAAKPNPDFLQRTTCANYLPGTHARAVWRYIVPCSSRFYDEQDPAPEAATAAVAKILKEYKVRHCMHQR